MDSFLVARQTGEPVPKLRKHAPVPSHCRRRRRKRERWPGIQKSEDRPLRVEWSLSARFERILIENGPSRADGKPRSDFYSEEALV